MDGIRVSEYFVITPWHYIFVVHLISRSSILSHIILIHLDSLDTKRQPNQHTQWSSEITKSASGEIVTKVGKSSDVRHAHVQGQRSQTFYSHLAKRSSLCHRAKAMIRIRMKSSWRSVPAPGRTRLDISAQLRRRSSATGRHTRSPPESQGFHASHTAGFRLQWSASNSRPDETVVSLLA